MVSELTFPERRMMEHERRRASHPHRPQTVWGTVVVGVQMTLPTTTGNFSYNMWQLSPLGVPLSTFMDAKGLMR